jgi:hypothetical protein
MDRKGFIAYFLSLGGLAAIPKHWIKSYTKVYLLQCFVAGFRYYKGPELLGKMQTGDMLELVREPNNEHDACAIALHFNNEKIGFIPAQENEMLSRLLDAQVVELMAEVTFLEHNAATWENVRIAVYVLKESSVALPAQGEYLTQLETPKYTSLKRGDNVFRIHYEEGDLRN